MTNVDYTVEYDVVSSVIKRIHYNTNTSTAYVTTVGGYVYSYANVSQTEVARLVSAVSVGRYYNSNFKGKYTSKFLGRRSWVTFNKVTLQRTGPVTPQALTPVARPGGINITGTANTTSATAVSIQELKPAVTADGVKYTVIFDGGKEFVVDGATDVTDALVKFNNIAGVFVDTAKVEKLVIDFTGGNS